MATPIDYDQRKKNVSAQKSAYHGNWRQLNHTGKQKIFVQLIADSILPCWTGTPWDFNGTTEIPGQGRIACGYFVTTALRDVGLYLQRAKLAQCASE